MNYKKKIDTLHEMMHNSKDLKEVIDYFFDHLGEDNSFLSEGKRVSNHPKLVTLLQHTMKEELGEKVPVKLLLKHVSYRNFLHGTGAIDSKPFMLFYFEDSIIGLLAFSSLATGKMDMIRIKGEFIQEDDEMFAMV